MTTYFVNPITANPTRACCLISDYTSAYAELILAVGALSSLTLK
jgi:hypothetical protein